jgi:bifunctional non-homologous end joining protein LigD
VALTPGGLSDLEALEEALDNGIDPDLFYYAFDLLHLDGVDWRERPLLERKRRLQALLEPGIESPHVRYSEHVEGGGEAFFHRACQLGFEGAVSKKKNVPYRPGLGPDWVKVDCRKVREFLIGAFTDKGGLLVGIAEGPGLVYAGRVETGVPAGLRGELLARMERPDSPFITELTLEERRGVHWVEPRLAAEVSYSNWTRDRRLRHPSFVRMREPSPPAGKPA